MLSHHTNRLAERLEPFYTPLGVGVLLFLGMEMRVVGVS